MHGSHPDVPDEFPQVAIASSAGGFQNKLVLTRYGGRYYVPGNTPPERWQQWCESEKLIPYYAQKCIEARISAPTVSDGCVLQSVFTGALEVVESLSFEQIKYLFGRVADLLAWRLPELQCVTLIPITGVAMLFECSESPDAAMHIKTTIEMLFES